ncbi:VOC family protein [Chitinophaga sp. HK235]|uniref:VOC family protein n=1 Tax=Chitinophaga sp. HK235 TaxID=2952571 RepID=UPI001BA4614C|nr:VOC family protein [Chitinophaga sp. HK235]
MEEKKYELIPYITFGGNCEEALNFYANVLGGTFKIWTRYDHPAMNAPEAYRDKVLHARLQFNGLAIYASDIFPGKEAKKNSGDVSLSLTFPDSETAQKVFDQLAEGGQVGVPFGKQFWGEWHGNLTDKYGVKWMVNC